jgi:hypothetical protein
MPPVFTGIKKDDRKPRAYGEYTKMYDHTHMKTGLRK